MDCDIAAVLPRDIEFSPDATQAECVEREFARARVEGGRNNGQHVAPSYGGDDCRAIAGDCRETSKVQPLTIEMRLEFGVGFAPSERTRSRGRGAG
jgi:hypothetical protein